MPIEDNRSTTITLEYPCGTLCDNCPFADLYLVRDVDSDHQLEYELTCSMESQCQRAYNEGYMAGVHHRDIMEVAYEYTKN